MTESHRYVGEDQFNHPYKVQCACGEWCYDFAAHLERVGQATSFSRVTEFDFDDEPLTPVRSVPAPPDDSDW